MVFLRSTLALGVSAVALAAPLGLAGCGGDPFSGGQDTLEGSTDEGGYDGGAIPGPDGGPGPAMIDAAPGPDASVDATAQDASLASVDTGPTHEASAGCTGAELDCSGVCTAQGPSNCGSCGHSCASLPHVADTATCSAKGTCSFTNADCAPGWTHCTSNPDDGCETSIGSSPNCGACGVTCSGATSQCDGVGCVSSCTAPRATLCGGTTCVDTTSDPGNCGGCGSACPAGPPSSSPTCGASQCGFACNAGYATCGGACLLQTPDPTAGVFVAPGGPSASCGAISAPCGSITTALGVAAASARTVVYVADSVSQPPTPYLEQVSLPAGVTVQGGWLYTGGSSWSRPCALDPSRVVIKAPPGADRTVIAGYAGASTLDTLTVQSVAAAAPGQSLYGVFVSGGSGTNLTLRNVVLGVAAGGAGAQPPAATGAGQGGVAGCSPPTGNGGAGAAGAVGKAGVDGVYSASGFTPASAGPGSVGSPGSAGLLTAPGTYTTPAACSASGSPMAPGCSCTSAATSTGSPGTAGCPGQGSPGGAAGAGAGGSFGVFDWSGTVTIDTGAIATGGGGAGGAGGLPSGAVGTGTTGTTGAGGPVVETGCSAAGATDAGGGGCTSCTSHQGAGGVGTAGGPGGVGGPGGGGAGGDSYCLYAGSGASVTVVAGASYTCAPGVGGPGTGGGAAGVSGRCNLASCP